MVKGVSNGLLWKIYLCTFRLENMHPTFHRFSGLFPRGESTAFSLVERLAPIRKRTFRDIRRDAFI